MRFKGIKTNKIWQYDKYNINQKNNVIDHQTKKK